ncbi:hypothetical protein BHM03_00042448, partial [Ensete ventricosum]
YYILLPLFCSSFGLGDEKYENEDTLPRNASDPEEVCSSSKFIFIHHTLVLILELIIRCRRGSAEMLVNFDDLWPSDPISLSSQETTILQQVDASKYYHICGKEVPHGYWVGILLYYSFWSMVIFCRGSKKGTRGFRLTKEKTGQKKQFPRDPQATAQANTSQSHMQITPMDITNSERLHTKDNGTGDPRFPKITWPPKQLCPSCYLSYSRESNGTENIEWDEDEVFQFLVRYYGRTIASSKEATLSSGDDAASTYDIASSTNAVTVPVGAALAIAVASCAFGALACFWRTQQKNRNNTMVLFKKVIYFVITANVSGTEKVGTERIKNKSTITSMN